jgi:hypothetical protein
VPAKTGLPFSRIGRLRADVLEASDGFIAKPEGIREYAFSPGKETPHARERRVGKRAVTGIACT